MVREPGPGGAAFRDLARQSDNFGCPKAQKKPQRL
jgi:hypothetical protein